MRNKRVDYQNWKVDTSIPSNCLTSFYPFEVDPTLENRFNENGLKSAQWRTQVSGMWYQLEKFGA